MDENKISKEHNYKKITYTETGGKTGAEQREVLFTTTWAKLQRRVGEEMRDEK